MPLMSLLAHSWRPVRKDATLLPLKPTHATLGAHIGARRPPVTLALGELSQRGAIVRQDDGWLLVEGPSSEAKSTNEVRMPTLVPDSSDGQSNGALSQRPDALDQLSAAHAKLNATVAELHRRH